MTLKSFVQEFALLLAAAALLLAVLVMASRS